MNRTSHWKCRSFIEASPAARWYFAKHLYIRALQRALESKITWSGEIRHRGWRPFSDLNNLNTLNSTSKDIPFSLRYSDYFPNRRYSSSLRLCSHRFYDPSLSSGGDGNLSISPTPTSSVYLSGTRLKRRLSQTTSLQSIIQLGLEKLSRSGIKSSVNWDLGLPQLCGLHGTWSEIPHEFITWLIRDTYTPVS